MNYQPLKQRKLNKKTLRLTSRKNTLKSSNRFNKMLLSKNPKGRKNKRLNFWKNNKNALTKKELTRRKFVKRKLAKNKLEKSKRNKELNLNKNELN